MEILHKFKQNGYFTAELYHLVAKKRLLDPTEEITPSQYEREMRMSTSQRLQNLNNIEIDNMVRTGSKGRVPVLSFTPRVIVFQNFKPNDNIVAKFSVKNISKSPSYLNMVYKESSYFSVKPCSGQLLSRLAPGISVTFAVTFTPVQYEDYTHRVTFYTDVDQYIVAFIAMGPRPVFDFPDEISIPTVPMKVENCYLMTVHNVGTVPAGFTLQTKSPFSVQPKSAYLIPDQKIQIKVGFKTMHLGETSGVLYAILETGEHFHIKLLGSTHAVNIELEKAVVRFQDTYNTMVRQQTFKITNKSDHIITFMCMKNECVYYDFQEKVKLATIFYNVKDSESAKYTKLVRYDVLTSDDHERVYTRIFFDEIQALVADESLSFQDTHFSITPISGKLWPNKCTEIVITFSPKQVGEFEAIAYLDIDGVFDRVPLKMLGNSLPPSINLNLETLDMDCVYINKIYLYEVVAFNKGHINGVIVYKEVPTLFGSNIKCTPEMHCLRPGEREIFVISFSNSSQGPYFEEINFAIRDTSVVLKLYLKGEVVYPSLCFSIPCLDFRKVSVGVPKTLEVEVINESVVNVTASVKISSDGPEVSSMTLRDYAVADSPKPSIPQWPREFDIEPCRIEMGPDSRVSLKVTLTANLVRANQTCLELELEKSDSPPIILPVMFDAKVPQITPAPEIKLRACFLDYPYKQEIHLTVNDFWGYFTLEEPEEESTLEVTVGVKEGIIQPSSTFSLPVTIKTSVLGVQEYSIRLRLFGMSKSIEVCHIAGTGVRPIVTCTPIALHWGQVKLLSKSQKTLTLCNDSPVYVNFKASLLNKDGRWSIHPSEGHVEPESETDLVLTLYLLDADTYTNKAVLQLEKVKDIMVPLSATGIGTSILVGELRDTIFLGRHFTRIPLNATVVMENCGTRLHALEWSEHYKAPKTKPLTSGFFNLDPKLFKMASGEKLDLHITGLSHKVTTVKEMWYLVGSVEGINKKELLLECPISAEFVDPKIEVSSTMIDFQYDYGPYSEYYKLTDIITIKNVSRLPLDIDISVKPPFAIIQKQHTYKIPPEEEHLCCCICYNECDLNIPNMQHEIGPYQSRLFIDYLTLRPVEPTRKEPLHFFQDINKIKMAFNLTHTIEERLEDQETMKIQVLFDTTKHVSLKSKIYCDLMKIKFRGHKNKDAMKLVGKINFPNIFVLSPKVDFQSILNDSIESKTIQLQNLTPLLACYRFQWKKCSITYEKDKKSNVSYKTDSNSSGSKSKDPVNLEKMSHVEVSQSVSVSQPKSEITVRPATSKKDFKSLKQRIMTKISPMIDVEIEPQFEWIYKFKKLHKSQDTTINDVFQLIPHRGLLKPNEIQHIHVIFMPKRNISVRATLECEVLGGPPELISVFGQSSDLVYKINTHKLNFKIRSFHEPASEQLIITNVSHLPFEYKTYLNEPKFENELQGTILDLVPRNKILDPEEEAEIKVVMRPGVVGYFTRVFVLEIGHLPHIPIQIFGWGVIPQVYLSLNRPEIVNLNPEFGYLAIPALTAEYMSAINEFFGNNKVEQSDDSGEFDKCQDDPDLQCDWHICSGRDKYPSVMDIELAIERMLVIDHIKLRPEILTAYSNSNKMGPIPGFHTTPYVIDYGVVITGSTVQSTAEIINYGPIPTKIHFAKGTHIPTWLSVKICGKLNPGETGKLDVGFIPTSIDFTELEQNVETYFNLDVPYGITIPVQIKALCAVPYLMSNVTMINFGSVRCGDKIITSIPLKNVGKPTCIWYVTLRLKAPGPTPMVVLDSSGKYEPGEGGWLSIAFKPTMEMMYEGMLIFRFHMNPNKMTIPVIGQGILPQVHVIGPSLGFPPTLPWAETTEIYFGLTNPCPFPIELIIAHTDEKWKEEEEIYQLLFRYYNKPEEMLVPAVKPGDDLPPEIVGFYRRFTATVAKAKEEEAAALKAMTTKAATVAKKTKSPKNAPKIVGSTSPKKFRTEAEIIADEMRTLKENGVDPLKECLHVFDRISSGSVMEKHSKGLLVFVHGSPCEEVQCQEMAYSIGKELRIPTVNIDNCIVEALCECKCPAKLLILSTINELYQLSRSQPIAKSDSQLDGNEDEEEDIIDETEDEFQVILKKIEYLANNKNVGTPRSKASDKKKEKAPTSSVGGSHTALGGFGSSTLFNLDLIQELLIDYFNQSKFSRGLVLDSLKSMILKNPALTLTLVLKCKMNIRNIHLILCQSDFNKWAQAYEESIKENDPVDENNSKVYDETEIQEIIGSFEEMDEKEYKNASPELRAIYITYGLEARRKKLFDKYGNQYELARKEKENSKSMLNIDPSESKKKIKKEDSKGKPTTEYTAMNARYTEYYKVTYEQLINIANNWIVDECEMGTPLIGFNGQVVGAAQKKAKKKSELQLQTSEVSFSDRGFPLTLITCPCLRYKIALVNSLANSLIVKEALEEEEEEDILVAPEKRKEFTVLLPKTFPHINHEKPLKWRYLDEKPLKKCECNQLTDLNLLDDSTQDNVVNILSKWHCVCGKKMASSQTSTSEVSTLDKMTGEEGGEGEAEVLYPLPLRSVQSGSTTGGRLVLGPGDLVRCKYSFSPQIEGHFSVKRFVEVCGWPNSRVDINVSGICDLPRLDSRPKKMFENFVRRTVEDNVYKLTYLDDLKLFEFGPIFIGANRIYEEEYKIDLKNSSLIRADIDIEFLEETTVFQIDKNFIRLEPGCRGKLTISAAPADVGVHNVVLLFCIKDNPEIVAVNIACSGVVPIVEILPITKTIEYGKLLLYRREDDRFIVKNDSILPVMWKIRNAVEFISDFIIARSIGIVPRHNNQVVPVTYIACNVGIISNKILTIDIYDAEGRGNPMITENLSLSAECYDVMVECAYENPSEMFLNYGNVKVNSTVIREMYLLNRGKYNIYFKLKKVKNFPEPSLLRSFEAIPESGMIPASLKLVSIDFECTPTTSMNLVNVPAYTCTLLDGSKNQVVVAKFPICVTIASFYNTFTLFPLGELNFHIIPVGSGVIRDVIINNTSKCPVTYDIVLPEKYRIDPADQPQTKVKDNKLKVPPMKCGNFIILNDDNLLAPGTSRTLQIQFMATAARTFEETINFIISDTCPAEAQGVPLRLVGTGAMPTLDFWNLETTFREHLIVKNLSEYKVPEASPHCVFVEDSVTLHFFCVTVNTSYTAAIDLYNNGLVACALTMKLHYQANSNQDIFYLDKYETHIEPLLHKTLGVIFYPRALKEYRAVLDIRLKLLDNQEQSFKICLIGEGVIPRIQMVSPPMRHKVYLLKFPVTCLGSMSNNVIRFKNVSSAKSTVVAKVYQRPYESRPIFWLTTTPDTDHMIVSSNNAEYSTNMKIIISPREIATFKVVYSPIKKGRSCCDVKLNIMNNPYEHFTVSCEGEAFVEDVIIIGLEMLPMETDLEAYRSSIDGTMSTVSTVDSRKKSKSAPLVKRKSKQAMESKRSRRTMGSNSMSLESNDLKYVLDFGGCELSVMEKRNIILINNSDKVYKFEWQELDHVCVKPSVGYILPGEEKDMEIMFLSIQPVSIKKQLLHCSLTAISYDSLTFDFKTSSWDNRQIVTVFNHDRDMSLNERCETMIEEQNVIQPEDMVGVLRIIIVYSAVTEYCKYSCTLPEEKSLKDTFVYQTRPFTFTMKNTGNVPMKATWGFTIDDEFPSRLDKCSKRKNRKSRVKKEQTETNITDEKGGVSKEAHIDCDGPNEYGEINEENNEDDVNLEISHVMPPTLEKVASKVTLFSGSIGRESVDTWFEIDLPFQIEPDKTCLKPNQSQTFKVTFAPQDAFYYQVRLKSLIDNLDPYDQNVCCKIIAKSLIPYCHLDMPESDYLTSGRRKITGGVALPKHMSVLEFNVLGSGCYKKSFNVVNPTSEAYEFIFEMVLLDKPELIPVHCDTLKGYVEGGTSTEVTFTFSPTAPGVYESQWKFMIPVYSLTINLLVVGLVREPDVVFVPTILVIRNSLVGFTVTNIVKMKNNEDEGLKFEFKGNSLCNESGKTPVIMEPEQGILKPHSETAIKFSYTPIEDGPLSFKIFCSVCYMVKYLTLCVNALSYSINPKISYYLIGNEHVLRSDVITNIYLDETASTYQRTIPFKIRNDGSATFFFDWGYNCSKVKKYLTVNVEPQTGHVAPGNEIECTMYFTLIQVPVQAFPITLNISDGPEFVISLHANIKKPLYHFTCMDIDFGKCICNAPDPTYKKNLAFVNDDTVPVIFSMNFATVPELFVDFQELPDIPPGRRIKIPVYFRPKQVREYEFKLEFWVNSLCQEIVSIKGEGIPLLFDLYEGCQKSFNLGPVKVGEKIVRPIEVMNHSKVPIDATFIFRDMYPVIDDTTKSEATSVCLSPSATTQNDPGPSRVKMLQTYKDDKIREQIAMDIQNALSSLKVVPNKCKILPYRKFPLKIQFKPNGMISDLNVQLNMKVFEFERPLVRISGSATGMSLCFSQNSLQFGRVRKRGCKILKVMLMNKGDFGTRFCWQPLISDEFTISPMQGSIAARTNVTFTISFRPVNHNPFIKVWASCNLDNYMPLELAMYATCVDLGNFQNKTLYLECPVRDVKTEYLSVTNSSDDVWLVLSELSEPGPFETLREFNIEPNSTFEIPVSFKPKTIGKHERQVLFSPLGESALFVNLMGIAQHPNPNGTISLTVPAKDCHVEDLMVYNITEFPETYVVSTEIVRVIPDKFEGHFEIIHPDTVKVWGEAAATCRLKFVCYEECEMQLKVLFINEDTREYQFYNITATVTASPLVDTLTFVARAREIFRKELTVSNPLNEDTTFSVKCERLNCPEFIKIGRNSEATLILTFNPLVVGESEDYLEINNTLVGSYIYKVVLKCLPAKEKNLEYTTELGNCIPLRLRVQNNTDVRTEFITTASHPCILAEAQYALLPSEKGKFLVWFEPTQIGVQHCKLSFESPVAGEYVFNIKGKAADPKPQGPYEIKAGGFATIRFKNVFEDVRMFKIYVDRDEFYVKTLYETVKSKKDIKIPVYLNEKPVQGWGGKEPTGCLTIECYDPPEPKASWTYFLQGIP